MWYPLIIVSVLIGTWLYRRYRTMTLLERLGYSGPKPHFIYGNSKEYFSGGIKVVSSWLEEHGNVVAYYIGANPALMVMDDELLKAVQIKDFQQFVSRQLFIRGGNYPGPLTESHLIMTSAKRWKSQRSILTPTFNAMKLKQMDPVINDAIKDLISNITEASQLGAKEFNIYPLYQSLTMDVIGQTAFGIKTNTQKDPNHPFVVHSRTVLGQRPSFLSILQIWFPEFSPVLYPIRRVTIFIRELFKESDFHYLHSACRKIFLERKKNPSNRKDLLQAMIDAKIAVKDIDSNRLKLTADADSGDQPVEEKSASSSSGAVKYASLTENEVVGNSFLFMEAGYETTSTTLAYITHILVNYPDVQESAREEVKSLYETEGKLDYNSMAGLPYMEAMISETLRLYPPVTYFVNRLASEDYWYKGRLIPKGCAVTVPVPQLHRNPDYWPEPNKFDVTRFFKENKGNINPVHYQPFGTGPRNCVGMRFALLEIKLALAHVLLNFRFEAGPNTEIGDLKLNVKTNLAGPLNGISVKAVPL